MPTCAIILSGCGRGDGSEIHESVSILQHVCRLGGTYRCFAPDKAQQDVINHLTGEAEGGSRNCLVESARIARGEISPIASCRVEDFDALLLPGGFGAAKNLCSFARDGQKMAVDAEVDRLVRGFHRAGKPIGLACIAPVIAARVLTGVAVTLGGEGDAPNAVRAWGSVHRVVGVHECVVDEGFKVATAPAYMYAEANAWQVSVGIGKMVEQVFRLSARG